MPDKDDKQADAIREYAFTKYIEPARKQKLGTVKIRAGDVAKDLNLRKRMPTVCGAIGTVKFQTKYSVRLLERKGQAMGATQRFSLKFNGRPA